jgi:hypothetical protein
MKDNALLQRTIYKYEAGLAQMDSHDAKKTCQEQLKKIVSLEKDIAEMQQLRKSSDWNAENKKLCY